MLQLSTGSWLLYSHLFSRYFKDGYLFENWVSAFQCNSQLVWLIYLSFAKSLRFGSRWFQSGKCSSFQIGIFFNSVLQSRRHLWGLDLTDWVIANPMMVFFQPAKTVTSTITLTKFIDFISMQKKSLHTFFLFSRWLQTASHLFQSILSLSR